MRADFYQLGGETVEQTIPLLASKIKDAGGRLLVVSDDPAQLEAVGEALWRERPDDFLANGTAGGEHDARQPILLSHRCDAPNGARLVMFADGLWRDEGVGFDRAFLLFGEATLAGARAAWRTLGEREDIERRFWKREGGRWVEGP
ncbi:MAG: DNA polymerase III subunit chi [Candidatus Andeanibacterium colombiense]|uniref:DNA polymerase III subunit chi n=1 Tax=Candidatus Andeanibacterium colombiense TaxID=3121345 RepID=A0AAJ5X6Q2_9SPHN|nr:MAG: DNA polymerase III subunit chi [Sphingomonadaceae bacterium]